jgi:enterochelin esterase-like enzyme
MFISTDLSAWNWLLLAPAVLLLATAQTSTTRSSRRAQRIVTSLFILALTTVSASAATPPTGKLVTREIQSTSFRNSKIGISPTRKLVVYLPPGYDASTTQRYPVIYFFSNPLDPSFTTIFDKRGAQSILDAAIASGIIRPFLLVVPDMTTPVGSSWYVNSSATGNWEDFVIQELVPYIDTNFRTLPTRDSRGIAGDFMGGYGAIRLAMEHPDIFASVYALHPVGTGNGVKILAGIPNWDLMEAARTLDDVRKDGGATIFTSIFEAHVPDPNHPPLFIDFPAHRVNGQLVIDSDVMDRLRENFFLESLIGKYANNLKSLRAFKFDWSRSDQNFDHVYSNQAFTRKLNEYGIRHEAEEYNGMPNSDSNWSPEGRITTDLLPFFQRHVVF